MVVSNHPLASNAGAEMLAAGGNAIDAAIATLFTLTVVEPMMVGIIGGGMAHIRLADGSHRFVDGQSTVPLAVRPDTYTSKPGSAHDVFDTTGDENLTGPKAVAVPGSLKAWCETLHEFGTMSLADVMQPGPRTIRPDLEPKDAQKILKNYDASSAIVTTSDGELLGIVKIAQKKAQKARKAA